MVRYMERVVLQLLNFGTYLQCGTQRKIFNKSLSRARIIMEKFLE
jgi:hypothetical protein